MINFVKGDASRPQNEGVTPIVIAHIVNNIGAWGAGFVMAISRRWPQVRQDYINFAKSRNASNLLGDTQICRVGDKLNIANMFAQHEIRPDDLGRPPIRYDSLGESLEYVAKFAIETGSEVHMPYIGCGLAGGTWDKIEPIVKEQLIDKGVEVFVYEYQP